MPRNGDGSSDNAIDAGKESLVHGAGSAPEVRTTLLPSHSLKTLFNVNPANFTCFHRTASPPPASTAPARPLRHRTTSTARPSRAWTLLVAETRPRALVMGRLSRLRRLRRRN